MCPEIKCLTYDDYMEPNNLCLWHSGDIPTSEVKLRVCDNPNEICDLFRFGAFAWPTVLTQFKTNQSQIREPTQSPLYRKKTQVKCMDKNIVVENGLNNGRQCLESYQCKSRNCEWDSGYCKGKQTGDSCTDHSECDNGLACFTNGTWPYATTCRKQINDTIASCSSDWECRNNMGCITLFNQTTARCAKYYSLNDSSLFSWNQSFPVFNFNMTLDALRHHGRFCKSGTANRFSTTHA